MVIKDQLLGNIALKNELPLAVVTSIISHQFDSANEATENNNSIEISGFAKFIFNQKRAHKQMEKYESQLDVFSSAMNTPGISEVEKKKYSARVATAILNIKHLKPKLNNELTTDNRGVEK